MTDTLSHDNFLLTYLPTNLLTKKFAFTLAEVLITLGIIGIVAALTMPSLMANYQKKVLVTQLKKQVNVINNNFRRIMADEGVDKICDTSIAAGDCGRNPSASIDPNLYKKYFGLDYASDSGETANLLKLGGANVVLQTKDGAILAILPIGDLLFIDINGDKNPNLAGRDRFALVLEDGFIGKCTGDISIAEDDCKTVVNMEKEYRDDIDQRLAAWFFGGCNCADKIVHDGWQMKY